MESGVPSIFLSHLYLNFSMRFIYIRNVTKAFFGSGSIYWVLPSLVGCVQREVVI